MCPNLLVKLFRFSSPPFLERQRGRFCQEQRGAEAGERLRREHTKVPKMKPCEVRCGNPSQFEAERERTATEAAVWAVTFQERWGQSYKRICGQAKSESKPGNRESKAIKQLNYYSRRAIKRYSAHWITEPDSWKKSSNPHMHLATRHLSGTSLSVSPPRGKKNTWYHLSNELWLTFENVNVKPIFTPKKSFTAVTLFPSHLSSPLPLMLGRSVRESKKKKKKERKNTRTKSWGGPERGPEANLQWGGEACNCAQEEWSSIWFSVRNITALENWPYT